MRSRLLPVFLIAVAAAVPANANLLDTWQEVQVHLSNGDMVGAEQAIEALQEEAIELEVRRMPAFAAALVAWAEANPGADGDAMLRLAGQLDPEYPSGHFLSALWTLDNGATLAANKEAVAGMIALVKFEATRRAVVAGVIMWVASAVVVALISLILVVVVRYLRGIVFDARDLGGKIFNPANAWVFAFVLILLPVFAALGPMWLGIYLFVLSWSYMGQALRIWSFIACLVLAVAVPTLA